MRRISTTTRVVDKFGAGKDGFTNGDVVGGIAATDLEDVFFDHLQEELATLVESAGIVLSGAVRTQVAQGIKRMLGGNITTVNFAATPVALTVDMAGLVIMDATGGAIVANLPAVNAIAQPLKFRFVRIDATGNTATVNRAGADTFVGGAASFTLSGQNEYRAIEGDLVSKWATTAVSVVPPSLVAVVGAAKNYRASAIGVNNYNCVVTADEIVLENSSNQYKTIRALNKTINANGAVGSPLSVMQTRTASSMRYIWVWDNASLGTTAVLDTSPTAPTAPTGYVSGDFKAKGAGIVMTDASGSTYLLQTSTSGTRTEWVPLAGSNMTQYPVIASGALGAGAALAAVSVSTALPTAVATRVRLLLVGVSGGNSSAAPSAAFTGISGGTLSPPINSYGSTSTQAGTMGEFKLESTNVYYFGGAAGCSLQVMGWDEN